VREEGHHRVNQLLGVPAVSPDDAEDAQAPRARFVERAHQVGVRVGTWTVDDRETFGLLLDWGVDAVASNDPAMGLEVLAGWRGSGSG